MNRYIDADNLKEQIPKDLHADVFENCSNCELLDDEQVKELIDLQPTADVRKNIKAQKVIGGGEHDGATCWFECSHCHGTVDIEDAYCKHCGAVLEYEK